MEPGARDSVAGRCRQRDVNDTNNVSTQLPRCGILFNYISAERRENAVEPSATLNHVGGARSLNRSRIRQEKCRDEPLLERSNQFIPSRCHRETPSSFRLSTEKRSFFPRFARVTINRRVSYLFDFRSMRIDFPTFLFVATFRHFGKPSLIKTDFIPRLLFI